MSERCIHLSGGECGLTGSNCPFLSEGDFDDCVDFETED